MVAVHLEHVVTICTIILFAARPRLGLREWAMDFVVKLEILRRRSSPLLPRKACTLPTSVYGGVHR